MNCGCYGYEISKLVISVDTVTFNGKPKSFNKDQIKFFIGEVTLENQLLLRVLN